MEIRNDSHVYNLSDAVGRSQVYNMYLCATETGRQCLLLIASLIEQNGVLDRIVYILRELKACADEIKQQNKQELIIIIHQGWKRQIRRMLSALDYQVLELTRLGEGKLTLGSLPVGEYREIKRGDII